MIGIYHSRDLDGYTSAAIIALRYPEAKLIGYDYGQPFNVRINNEPVIMADISLPMEQMFEIARQSNWQFTWIDHHISAIKDHENFTADRYPFCNAVLENGIAACEGTWKHLFPESKMPLAVQLLGEYDTWRNQDKDRWENKILPFQFGMRLHCNSPETFPIGVFYDEELVKEIINQGITVLKYKEKENQFQCKKAFESEFKGLRAICLNGGGFNSDVFKSVYNEEDYDLMMSFQFTGEKWIVSLYTTKETIDCSILAKQMGGGGHQKAAGFQVEHISSVFPNLII